MIIDTEEQELLLINKLLINPNLNDKNKEYLNDRLIEKLFFIYKAESYTTEYMIEHFIERNKELVEKKLNNNSDTIIKNFIQENKSSHYSESISKLILALKNKYNIEYFENNEDVKIELEGKKGSNRDINKYIVKQFSEIIIKEKIKQLQKEITNLKNG